MIEEAADTLARFVRHRHSRLTASQIAWLESTIRDQRVSVLKQRAIIGALDFRAF